MKAYALRVTKSGNVFSAEIKEVNHRSTMRGGGSNFDDGRAQFAIYSKQDVISVHVDSETVGYVVFSHTKEGAFAKGFTLCFGWWNMAVRIVFGVIGRSKP